MTRIIDVDTVTPHEVHVAQSLSQLQNIGYLTVANREQLRRIVRELLGFSVKYDLRYKRALKAKKIKTRTKLQELPSPFKRLKRKTKRRRK